MTDFQAWWNTVNNDLGNQDLQVEAKDWQFLYWRSKTPAQAVHHIQNYLETKKIADKYDKWDLRFLEQARVISTWSKDPSTKCGAVIINPQNQKVVGVGYNGFPRGMSDAQELYDDREIKYSRVIHCEMNAVLDAGHAAVGATLYTWPFMSCDRCTVHVIQAGIKRCVAPIIPADAYSRWGPTVEKSRRYLKEANVLLDELDLGL